MRNVVTLVIVDNSDGYSVAGAEDRFCVHWLNVPFGRMAGSDKLRVGVEEEEPMERPYTVSAIGWFLIIWNGFLLLGTLPQDLYYHNLSPVSDVVARIFSSWSLFIFLGANLLYGHNWARKTYLIFAPIHLLINSVVGTYKLGLTNLIDRIPSIVVTALFVVLLLTPKVFSWFSGVPCTKNNPTQKTFLTGSMLSKYTTIIFCLILTVIVALWMTNNYIRVDSKDSTQSKGLIENFLEKDDML
jgi:hypothetical protein